MSAWPERLEIHFQLDEDQPDPTSAILNLEEKMDDILGTLGTVEGNEVDQEEWTTYVDCGDADAALAALMPGLKSVEGVASVYAVKCCRVVIR